MASLQCPFRAKQNLYGIVDVLAKRVAWSVVMMSVQQRRPCPLYLQIRCWFWGERIVPTNIAWASRETFKPVWRGSLIDTSFMASSGCLCRPGSGMRVAWAYGLFGGCSYVFIEFVKLRGNRGIYEKCAFYKFFWERRDCSQLSVQLQD